MSRIPNHYHFVFGLKEQSEEFHVLYYLCLRSCLEVNQPEKVFFYYHFEPHGPWWDKIKPELELVHVELERFVINNFNYYGHREGRYIQAKQLNYAHQADFIRLKVLKEKGGIYADMDTLFVNPLPEELFKENFVIGTEGQFIDEDDQHYPSLCNALMMSQANSQFVSTWLSNMYDVFDGTWSKHSCQEASKLADSLPSDECKIVPKDYFYKYDFSPESLERLFVGLEQDNSDIYSMHLWNHLWWDKTRTDFSNFHSGLLTEDYVRHTNTTYSMLARRFMPSES